MFGGCDTSWSAPKGLMTVLHSLCLPAHAEDWLWYDYLELNQ